MRSGDTVPKAGGAGGNTPGGHEDQGGSARRGGPPARAAVGQTQASPERVCPGVLLHRALADFRVRAGTSTTGHFSTAATHMLSDIKTYCEATSRDTQSWQKGRCADQWKREGSLEVAPGTYLQRISDKGAKTIQSEKEHIFNKQC